jgi:hypothetical protein
MSIANIETSFNLEKEYTLTELSEVIDYNVRCLQYEVKAGRLKYLYKLPPRHGGAVITGYQVLDWFFEYRCNGLIKRSG